MKDVWLAIVLLFALTGSLFAQATGSMDGRVTDPAGAAVPGASVTATNTNTGLVRNTVTTAEGLYSLPGLIPGSYQVKAEKSGFAPVTQAITVFVGSNATGNLALALAGTSQQVLVSGEVPLVEITQSDVSGTLATQEVQELPMLNRNFTGLATLVPGARQAPILDTSKANMGASIAVGGSDGRNVGYNVDGAENRDMLIGGAAMDYTLEGIQEFKLLAHNFGAQYSRSGGGVLEIATKSGTNAIHGSAFAFGRNDAMTAADYFTKQASLPKNSYDREQFGGSFGGPAIKNRWFYFGAIERMQQNYVETEPLAAYNQAVIVANAVPSLGIVPAKTMIKPFDNVLYTLKSDYQIKNNQSLFVRFAHENDSAQNDQIGVAQVASGGANSTPHPDLSSPDNTEHHTWSIVGSYNWVISNSSLNQISLQRNHYEELTLGNYANPFRQLSFPSITLGGYYAGGLHFLQDKYQLMDNFSHQAGAHALKIGGSFAWAPNTNIGADVVQQRWTTFTADPSTIVSNTTKFPLGFQTPGAAFAMIVGNLPGSQDGKTIPPLLQDDAVGLKQMGLYVQDDWRIRPDLTLNLGVRYDLTMNGFDQPEAANGRVYLALKAIGNPYGKLPSTPTRDFQPRVGLVWNIGGRSKDVLRGGFGIFRNEALWADVYTPVSFMKATLNPRITYVNIPGVPNPLANYVLGVGPLPPAPAPVITQLPAGASGYLIDPSATDPYTIQTHAGYTHQITQNLVIGADFSHIQSVHEWRNRELNPTEGVWDPHDCTVPVQGPTGGVYSACPTANRIVPYGTRRLASAFAAAGVPALSSTTLTSTDSRSRFDEFLVHVEHRANRLTLQASYTLSYANAFGGISAGLATGATTVAPPNNPDQSFGPGEWGSTSTDERHRVVISAVTHLPWGIEIAPVLQAASARPYTLQAGVDYFGTGATAGQRYVDPATGQPVGVNSQRGDATFNLDFRATKSFNLKSESRKLLVFAEFYNLTNRANFGNVFSAVATAANFKQPIGYLAGFPSSRQLQLGARFIF